MSTLKASLLNKDTTINERLKSNTDLEVSALQKELQALRDKNEKQKRKIDMIVAS